MRGAADCVLKVGRDTLTVTVPVEYALITR